MRSQNESPALMHLVPNGHAGLPLPHLAEQYPAVALALVMQSFESHSAALTHCAPAAPLGRGLHACPASALLLGGAIG